MSGQSLKKLVVYYSLEGNTKFIAEVIADKIGAELLELKPQTEINSRGFLKYFVGGRQSLFKQSPKLESLTKNPQDYDLLFIGTPVWAWNYAPPLRSFFSSVKLSGKKIALFCCCQGQKGKTFAEMRKALAGNEILGEKEFFNPLNNRNENKKTAEEWAKQIISLII
ncbi:MAG TPA: flavodoxin [Clostridia bacterium]|nr:flavodoxin [Clostridia bacterium]